MESKFECVVHHGGCFGQLHHADYNGAEKSWFVDPDYWSYFEIKDNLKEKLGYKVVESLWFYDPMNINGMEKVYIVTQHNHVRISTYANLTFCDGS
jgi:hypothetical protein